MLITENDEMTKCMTLSSLWNTECDDVDDDKHVELSYNGESNEVKGCSQAALLVLVALVHLSGG